MSRNARANKLNEPTKRTHYPPRTSKHGKSESASTAGNHSIRVQTTIRMVHQCCWWWWCCRCDIMVYVQASP